MADVVAPDFIPDSQVPQQAQGSAPDFIPDDQVPQEQQPQSNALTAGAEGVAKGILGPAAPYIEHNVFQVPYSEQRQRAAEHPIAKGVGEAVGLGAGMLTGTGEAAVMGKAGEGAAALAGLSEPASFVAKVGSSAVKQAAEMAVLQGSDEAAKQVINDPEASSQSAIANIGLAAALGGAGGAFITGAVSPLWDATVGGPVEKFLGGMKDYLNGEAGKPSDSIMNAARSLGVELSPEMQAGMSGNPWAAQKFNELREAQHPKIQAGIEHLDNATSNAVMQAIGKSPEEIANYSEAEGGRAAMDSFKKEYSAKYKPIADEFEKITKPFEASPVAESQKSTLADRVAKMAQDKGYVGPDLPQNKVIDAVLTRIPGLNTANDFAKLNTTINNLTHGDFQLAGVRRDLQSVLTDMHHNVLADTIGQEAPGLMSRYEAVRGAYKDLANISSDIGAELGLGKFVGPKTLLAKLAEKRSPEEFLRKLSPKGNAEIIGFLGQHFPETLEQIRDNELKQLIKPSVLAAKGDNAINSKVLNNGIERALAGQPERVKFALPNGALEKIQAAHTLQNAIPGMKSSGTAGWQQKMFSQWPASALATVAGIAGHNPVMGYVAGHLGKLMARDVPDAVKLGLLRFMGSDQPIKAQGFKALVDFMHNTIKGEQLLTRATGNVFKAGAQVLTDSQMPSKEDRQKLEKIINTYQNAPEHLLELTNGQVGHYLPGHQAALTQTAAQSVQYLAKLKPQPYKPGPLDKPIEPSQAQLDRYHRALDIANQPALVMQHIKNGTLQISDLQDLKTMYPALYNSFSQRLTTEINNNVSEENHIPYKTRIGLSLFLGQPIDTTMSPQSIMSAQPVPPPPKAPAAAKTKDLAKGAKSAQTPEQAAEERKVNGK